MNVRQLLDDDQAVSPVIGVILMVAITVILAAVIGTFVLGLGSNLSQSAPTASFSFDYNPSGSPDKLTIVHAGGDTISASNTYIKATGAINNSAESVNGTTSFTWANLSAASDSAEVSEISAGDTLTIQGADSNADLGDDTVRVVWQSAGGDQSATLGKWSGPDAS